LTFDPPNYLDFVGADIFEAKRGSEFGLLPRDELVFFRSRSAFLWQEFPVDNQGEILGGVNLAALKRRFVLDAEGTQSHA
jgi:hypothetical protein